MYKGINRTDQSDPIMLLICLASANPVFPRAAQAIPAGNSPTSRAVHMANPETVSPSRDLSVSVVSNFETTESAVVLKKAR